MIHSFKNDSVSKMEEYFERMDIAETIEACMKNYAASKNVSWEEVREERNKTVGKRLKKKWLFI